MHTNGPTWAVTPQEWGAQIDYDSWTDEFTPDDGVALHHGGGYNYAAGNPPYSEGAEAAQLRGWEKYHLGKGWRGLAYGWAVGQTGKVYRIRGWSSYGAHLGDMDGDGIANNDEIIPIIFIGSGNWVSLSPAAQASVERLRRYLEEESGALRLYGHQELGGSSGTTCPGPKLMDYVRDNRLVGEEEEEDMTIEELKAVLVEHDQVRDYVNSAGQTRRISMLGVNSTWHVDSGGKRTLELLDAAAASGELDADILVDLIVEGLGTELAGQIADDLAARLSN